MHMPGDVYYIVEVTFNFQSLTELVQTKLYWTVTIDIFSKDWKLRLKGIQMEGLLIH